MFDDDFSVLVAVCKLKQGELFSYEVCEIMILWMVSPVSRFRMFVSLLWWLEGLRFIEG